MIQLNRHRMCHRIFPLLGGLFYFFAFGISNPLSAQTLSLSVGASAGYAPLLTYGRSDRSGGEIALFADLEYGKAIGRFQFTYLLPGTVANDNLKSGYAFHGSLGYNAPVTAQLSVPLMLTGGVSIVRFTAFGSAGTFTDASPQIGLTVSPYYKINDQIALQLALRYIHGFVADTRSDPIHLADALIGIRYTL